MLFYSFTNHQVDQPQLAIDREYLIKGFEDEIVKAYYNYHVDTMILYGADRFNAEIEAKKVLMFEMDLAQVNLTFAFKFQNRNISN
jgi:neprilysin